MIKTFDFGIYPSRLFVAVDSSFEELKDRFVFEITGNGNVELTTERFNGWSDAMGVTINVTDKETLREGYLVYLPDEFSSVSELVGTIAHEAMHVVNRLYGYIGVNDGNDSEIDAYLIGWVSKNIMLTYNKSKDEQKNGTEDESQSITK